RFGEIEFRSRLRTAQVYGAYARFLGFALLFSLFLGIVGLPALLIAEYIVGTGDTSARRELFSYGILLVGYVFAMLGYSTIYRATVQLSLWQAGMEALQMSNISTLERVKAT